MKTQSSLLALLGLTLSSTLHAAPGTTLEVDPEARVAGSIGGQPVHYRVMADAPSLPILSPDAAARLGVKPGFIAIGIRAQVGPTTIDGQTATLSYEVAGLQARRRVAWFDRPFATDADAIIGPASVPQSLVSFRLHAPGPGEQPFVIPLVDQGAHGLGTQVRIGNAQVFVQFDLSRDASIATAAAAADLGLANGGHFVDAGWQETIRLGVARPVRRMPLDRPFTLGPLRINEFLARVGDYGDVSTVNDAHANTDENEIVISATGPKRRAVHALLIGRAALSACSEIDFDKPRRQIVLDCRAPAVATQAARAPADPE